MVREIRFSARQWSELRDHLLGRSELEDQHDSTEQLAFILAGHSTSSNGIDLVARELLLARDGDLEHQSRVAIAPTGDFVASAWTRCQQEGWSLIEVHSHPFDSSSHTTFSGIDWENDRAKMSVVATAHPEPFRHVTMVIGQSSIDAHYFDRARGQILPVSRLTIVGADGGPRRLVPTSSRRNAQGSFTIDDRHNRQISILGVEAQRALSEVSVAIVGLGGLGSFVALQLAHLGVGKIVLVDPDSVDVTNLNRLIGADNTDVGKLKVQVYADLIAKIDPKTTVTTIAQSILSPEALFHVKGVDVISGCVDNHGARLVMNHLAIQYLIPLVDAGTGARIADAESETQIGGQVQLVLPALGCLGCRGFIDAKRAAFDLAPVQVQDYERSHGYGFGEVAPSVIFLNGVIASVQVAQIAALLGARATPEVSAIVFYDALTYALTPAATNPDDYCPTCGLEGVAGFADLAPLRPARESTVDIPTARALD